MEAPQTRRRRYGVRRLRPGGAGEGGQRLPGGPALCVYSPSACSPPFSAASVSDVTRPLNPGAQPRVGSRRCDEPQTAPPAYRGRPTVRSPSPLYLRKWPRRYKPVPKAPRASNKRRGCRNWVPDSLSLFSRLRSPRRVYLWTARRSFARDRAKEGDRSSAPRSSGRGGEARGGSYAPARTSWTWQRPPRRDT